MQSLARAAGWPAARLPAPGALSDDAQDLIKALIVSRCMAGNTADSTQIVAKACRRILSLTARPPWELRAEDCLSVLELKEWSVKAWRDFSVVGKIVDENLLSLYCPVRSPTRKMKDVPMLARLDERVAQDKLPGRDALFELVRIVFQEEAVSHNDAIYFLLVRMIILTGLRVAEVQMLPLDCLDWQEHLDTVTGQSAQSVGGVGRSLRLRYFAEKRKDGGPGVLVEAFQWVPAKFESEVVRAVEEARVATASVRIVLKNQLGDHRAQPSSDLRTFRTVTGKCLDSSDLLFLTVGESMSHPLDLPLPSDTVVNTPFGSRLYTALGRTKGSGAISFYRKYGKAPGAAEMSVKPHALRHLLNTELFRLNVPDTAITHQFGRISVAQSYEYDHRSLAEQLRFVELPASASTVVPKGSTQEFVAKMIVSGAAVASHIGQTFKKIQAEQGEDAAFRYLAANSDGFHVTPYGFCTNSFSVSPCARHLKCFDNCKHFMVSGIPEHKTTLMELREKLIGMRDAAASRPFNTIGRFNQIAHAERLVEGVSQALAAQPRQHIFVDGKDYALPTKDLFK
ncbi:hypothetical protein [Cupriavidus campinensis]